jgi:hypothetical protein
MTTTTEQTTLEFRVVWRNSTWPKRRWAMGSYHQNIASAWGRVWRLQDQDGVFDISIEQRVCGPWMTRDTTGGDDHE